MRSTHSRALRLTLLVLLLALAGVDIWERFQVPPIRVVVEAPAPPVEHYTNAAPQR